MIAIKDAIYKVYIFDTGKYWWGIAGIAGSIGLSAGFELHIAGKRNYKTAQGAISSWKKFAQLNGITKYTVEVEK